MHQSIQTAVVGGGIAGLTCASMLGKAGHSVTLFDKSRGLGGRMASRRTDTGSIDHGARYVEAHTQSFSAFLESAQRSGVAEIWPTGSGTNRWYVGIPAMNSMVKPLANGLTLRLQTTVTRVQKRAAGWTLETAEEGEIETYDRVVVAVPAPQASAILRDVASLDGQFETARMAPCWAYLAAFETPLDGVPDLPRNDDPRVAWVARDSVKPGRAHGAERWVLHASAAWSREVLELDRHAVLEDLRALFAQAVGCPVPTPVYEAAHRWRYAFTETPLGRDFLSDPTHSLYVCGDWCLGDTCEHAYLSGRAVADAICQRDGPATNPAGPAS